MELDGRNAAGSSLEPEQGAIAEPHWLWEAIAVEALSSVEMEDVGDYPNAGPDAGNEQNGGGSAALSRDDQRDDSALDVDRRIDWTPISTLTHLFYWT